MLYIEDNKDNIRLIIKMFFSYQNQIPNNISNNNNNEFYDILEVNKNATQEDIKKSYYKLAKKLHPDQGGCSESFVKLQNAYDTLSDIEKRKVYDNRHQISLFHIHPMHPMQNNIKIHFPNHNPNFNQVSNSY